MTNYKIVSFDSLIQPLVNLKSAGKKIVYAQGFFDLFHIGHVYHLKKAKKLGDVLVVGVVSGRYFRKRSGQPLFQEEERMKFVSVLDCVDFVVLNDAADAIEAITKIKPAVYAKGEDVREKAFNPAENLYREIKVVEAIGGRVCFTKSLAIHSSDILAKLSPEEIADLKNEFKETADFKEWVKNHLFGSPYYYQDILIKNTGKANN